MACVRSKRTPLQLEWDGIDAALYHPVPDIMQLRKCLGDVEYSTSAACCSRKIKISADAARGDMIGSTFGDQTAHSTEVARRITHLTSRVDCVYLREQVCAAPRSILPKDQRYMSRIRS